MALTPTLNSCSELYLKMERESVRLFHAPNPKSKADHLYNFCVTAHSLRDYFLNENGIYGQEKDEKHSAWNRNAAVLATMEIANATKHLTLRQEAKTKGTDLRGSTVFDIFALQDGGMQVREQAVPEVFLTLCDGREVSSYEFARTVLSHWKEFLSVNGVEILAQSFEDMHGLPRECE